MVIVVYTSSIDMIMMLSTSTNRRTSNRCPYMKSLPLIFFFFFLLATILCPLLFFFPFFFLSSLWILYFKIFLPSIFASFSSYTTRVRIICRYNTRVLSIFLIDSAVLCNCSVLSSPPALVNRHSPQSRNSSNRTMIKRETNKTRRF